MPKSPLCKSQKIRRTRNVKKSKISRSRRKSTRRFRMLPEKLQAYGILPFLGGSEAARASASSRAMRSAYSDRTMTESLRGIIPHGRQLTKETLDLIKKYTDNRKILPYMTRQRLFEQIEDRLRKEERKISSTVQDEKFQLAFHGAISPAQLRRLRDDLLLNPILNDAQREKLYNGLLHRLVTDLYEASENFQDEYERHMILSSLNKYDNLSNLTTPTPEHGDFAAIDDTPEERERKLEETRKQRETFERTLLVPLWDLVFNRNLNLENTNKMQFATIIANA